MIEVNLKDEELIKELFDNYVNSYQELAKKAATESAEIYWTNGHYINFLPFFNERMRNDKLKILKKEPKNKQNNIVNKKINDKIIYSGFYSTNEYINAERFYLYEEDKSSMLHYSFGREKKELDKIVVLFHKNNTDPDYSLTYYKDSSETSIIKETYIVNNGKVTQIEERGYTESSTTKIPVSNDFKIIYNDDQVEIFGQQNTLASGKIKSVKVYPLK